MRLEGKTAFVTGGSRGIGRAIATKLASEGARVAVLGRSPDSCEEVAQAIEGDGGHCLPLPGDVTDYASVEAAVRKANDELGSLDILINNAGIGASEYFVKTDENLWDRLIGVNYKGFLVSSHVCIPYMMAQESGCIVSLGSDAGRVGTSGEVLYSGTKAAVMASSKALARELARYNIRVNCVSPGPVETDLLAGLHEGEKGRKVQEAVTKMIPMKRIGQPQDVADVVCFFCTDDARYVTGQVLSVDGGLTMIG